MRRPSRTSLLWMLLFCASIPSVAQNIESIGREKPFSVNGGISINQIFYKSRGVTALRDPYTYFASGNINFSFYGWSVPLTFGVSNGNTSFSQPFNRYALHPTWKWINLHAGYTSMSFSPYTVNGHIFLGTGVDLTPEGNWKVSALYGRFLKPVEADTARQTTPAFQRMGYAMKVSYNDEGNTADLIIFRATDDETSIARPPDSLRIAPQENLVVSMAGSKRLFRKLVVRGEMAASALTRDQRAEKTTSDHALAMSSALFQPRLSSAYYRAFKTSADYEHNGWVIGAGYERIDPGYQTLGAYYFNNDLENITINASGAMKEGKLNVAASAGVQHDNVDKAKISTMRRIVSSFNFNYMPSPHMNVSGTWSSFGTYTNIRSQFESINQLTPYDNLDTLNFTQISRNASLSGMYSIPGLERRKQSVSLNISWQKASDRQAGLPQYSGNTFCNLNAGYAVTISPGNTTTAAITVNATVNNGEAMRTRTMGPTASFTRSFLNRKIRTIFSSSWNKTYHNGSSGNSIANCRLNGAVSIRDSHNVNMSAVLARRTGSERIAVTEFTATIGYSYSFRSPGKKSEVKNQ